jgi:serine phosphatase RsbU (regulator of sigma subunit)
MNMADSGIRRVRFGLGLKFGLFLVFVLFSAIALLGFFTVRRQERALKDSLQSSLRGSLATYRSAVVDIIGSRAERQALRNYTYSMTNIENLQTAMLIAPNGEIWADITWDSAQGRYESKEEQGLRYNPGKNREDWLEEKHYRQGEFLYQVVLDRKDRQARPYPSISAYWHSLLDGRNPAFQTTVRRPEVEYREELEAFHSSRMAVRATNQQILSGNRALVVSNLQQLAVFETELDTKREALAAREETVSAADPGKAAAPEADPAWRALAADVRRLESRISNLQDLNLGLDAGTNLLPAPVFPENEYFEGVLPIYINVFAWQWSRDDTLARALALASEWVGNGARFPVELSAARRDDLALLAAVEDVRPRFFSEVRVRGVLQRHQPNQARINDFVLRKTNDLTYRQVYLPLNYRVRIERFRKGQLPDPKNTFTPAFQKDAARLLRIVYGARLPGELLPLLGKAERGVLFTTLSDDEEAAAIKTAVAYVELAERFDFSDARNEWRAKWIAEVLNPPDREFPYPNAWRFIRPVFHPQVRRVREFGGRFAGFLRLGRYALPGEYRAERLETTYYPQRSVEDRGLYLDHAFRTLPSPFRFGFLRIVVNPARIREQVGDSRNQIVNMGAALGLRLVFLAILFSGFLIRGLRTLAAGARAVGQGDFSVSVSVKGRDEIGQLADQFNEMVGEIREKLRMQGELDSARRIQGALIPAPDAYPVVPGFSFAGFYRSQTEAGGDYYDILPLDDGRIGLVIADVSSHGVGAGLVMTMFRAVLRAHAPAIKDAATVLKQVNPQIHRDTLPAMFATAFYAVVDPATRRMNFASAGHNQALLLHVPTGKLEKLHGDGMPVGMFGAALFDPPLSSRQATLHPGHLLLLYTDGVTEAMDADKQEYEEERLIAALLRHAELPLDDLLEALVADLQAFTGGLPQEDDISLLIMRVE